MVMESKVRRESASVTNCQSQGPHAQRHKMMNFAGQAGSYRVSNNELDLGSKPVVMTAVWRSHTEGEPSSDTCDWSEGGGAQCFRPLEVSTTSFSICHVWADRQSI